MERTRRTFPADYTPDGWIVRRDFLRYPRPLPDPPFKESESVGRVVSRLVSKMDLSGADPVSDGVSGAWHRLVPPDVAAHAKPGPIDRGVLTLVVQSSIWRTELRSRQRTLLAQINASLEKEGMPLLKGLKFSDRAFLRQ